MSVVQSTGPGIWSDAVMVYLDETYGAVFDDQDFISDKLIKFGPEKAREEALHVGSVLMLPVRAFGMKSGGYTAKPEHKFGDIFAQHYFQGSWKNKPQGGEAETPTVYSPCHRHPIKSHELICGLSESALLLRLPSGCLPLFAPRIDPGRLSRSQSWWWRVLSCA